MELHEWLMFFHVLASMVWVGAVIFTNAMMTKASRDRDPTSVVRVFREVEWAGPRLIGPSAAVVIGLGIWLVILEEDISFFQPWIWLTLLLLAFSMGQNGIYSAREGRRVTGLAEDRGAADPEVRRRFGRLLWLGRLDVLILAIVVGLMVFKPGGPPN